MAIITKPTIAKGQANEIDLSKSDLAAVSKVVNDSYFSNQANWSKVAMEYESDTGEQIEMLIFDASQESPKANFEVSEKAKDSWQVKSVIIMDFDGGYLKLNRGDLTVENFDIALGSVGGDIGAVLSASSFNTNLASPSFSFTNNNYTAEETNNNGFSYRVYASDSIEYQSARKVYKEVTFDTFGRYQGISAGFRVFNSVPTDFNRDPNGNFISMSDEVAEIYYFQTSGNTRYIYYSVNGGNTSSIGITNTPSLSEGDKLGIAVDLESNKAWFSINGVYTDGGNPETNSGGYNLSTLFNGVVNANNLYFAIGMIGGKTTIEENPTYAPEGYEPV